MNIMKKAVIFGAGTYAEVFLYYLQEAGFNIVGFFDDDISRKGDYYSGLPILGGFEDLKSDKFKSQIDQIFCPIGNNKIRVKYLSELFEEGYEIPNFFHKSVIYAKDLMFGKGVYLLPGVIIMPIVELEDFVIVSMGTKVAHHTKLEKGVFVSSGVVVGASILVKKRAFIGVGATVMTGVKEIGKDAYVGSGAVVIKDVEKDDVVAGVPAKVIKPNKNILIFGTSGHAKVVIDIIEKERKYKIAGLLDSFKNKGELLFNYSVLGGENNLVQIVKENDISGIIVAIGDNFVRKKIVTIIKELLPKIIFINAIHPSVKIGKSVKLGQGIALMPSVVINSDCVIGDFCFINTNSSLGHDGEMHDFSSISSGVKTGGNLILGSFSAISIGSTIIENITIGNNTIIGAGSMVNRSIPSNKLAFGVPARIIKERASGGGYLAGRKDDSYELCVGEIGKVHFGNKYSQLLSYFPNSPSFYEEENLQLNLKENQKILVFSLCKNKIPLIVLPLISNSKENDINGTKMDYPKNILRPLYNNNIPDKDISYFFLKVNKWCLNSSVNIIL